jgi:hypothetical protein
MFDVSPDDISQLDDTNLRALVARLCEAELHDQGLSPAAVTYGGHQNAPDGGIDVRVDLSAPLPNKLSDNGFIPRPATGFQVKAQKMPRAAIEQEMRPSGSVRPVIQKLAAEAGAYIIASSEEAVSDGARQSRRNAMRDALADMPDADRLHTDFYDRTRLATWVRQHPGVGLWVKELIGKAVRGWRPYGAWSGAAEGTAAPFLPDEKLRIHLQSTNAPQPLAVVQAIDQLRTWLAQPKGCVRLVGLSGVGKTRLVQALFEADIGARPLLPSLAVYTNLSDEPDPQPPGMISDLIANQRLAVVIVDNCPADLHRRLSHLCKGPESTVSVLTIEYDIRDDQPEGTEVVRMDAASLQLIEQLIERRYSHLSQINARTIGRFSDGNARIAIALAETVRRRDSLSGLSDDDLFQRLFWQRHIPSPDSALLRAAAVCALVYSFDGETLDGSDADELSRLATLANQTPVELYRHVSELLRRDLAQQRGVWRAVLPHALANRLAARALEDIPLASIQRALVEPAPARLARSFSRRLSFLHDQPAAQAIVRQWLSPGGLLGDAWILDDTKWEMFENAAPVLPDAALAAIELALQQPASAVQTCSRRRAFSRLLRSIAYDAPRFDRCAQDLIRIVESSPPQSQELKDETERFTSLFTIELSGTHATVEQRLAVIDGLFKTPDMQWLGLEALKKMLQTGHFMSLHPFEFGARSRDHGYWPKTRAEKTHWYRASLALIERLALDEPVWPDELRRLLAQHLRGLWKTGVHAELDALCRRFAARGFWREGWIACREVLQFDQDTCPPDALARLPALEAVLRPATLADQCRAMVLGWELRRLQRIRGDESDPPLERVFEEEVVELGRAVGADESARTEFLPECFGEGSCGLRPFGRGLAYTVPHARSAWDDLVDAFDRHGSTKSRTDILEGFLTGLCERDRALAHALLDDALENPALCEWFPVLQCAVELDERGIERLQSSLRDGRVPMDRYRCLAVGRCTDDVPGVLLRDLLLSMADQTRGVEVALDILSMRFFSDGAQRPHDPVLIKTGQDLLARAGVLHGNLEDDALGQVVRVCLSDADAGPIAALLAVRWGQTRDAWSEGTDTLEALLETQPIAVLNALFQASSEEWPGNRSLFDRDERNPLSALPHTILLEWCDVDPERRYPWIAKLIRFMERPNPDGPPVWSEQAIALLTHAPDPNKLLDVFVPRFAPTSWSGSLAAIVASNAQLLDQLSAFASTDLQQYARDAKTRVMRYVAEERQRETEQERRQNERFE